MVPRILILLIFSLSTTYSFGQKTNEFESLILENGLVFEKPIEFLPTAVIENGDLAYNYAMRLKQDSFEVRYSIFPLGGLLKDYKGSLNDPNRMVLDPNTYHSSMFRANILNVSQAGLNNMPGISDFPPEAVKKEFGADYGATSFFLANSEFGKNYKYCLMMVIHKKDLADVYVSFLGNDQSTFQEYMLKAFHAIKFKE